MGYETEEWRKPSPDGDEELISEHGRVIKHSDNSVCYRAYWLTITKGEYGGYKLRVKHGGGEEAFDLGYRGKMLVRILSEIQSSDDRYFTLFCMFQMASEAQENTRRETASKYSLAFVEKRLKKRRKNHKIYVDILPKQIQADGGQHGNA